MKHSAEYTVERKHATDSGCHNKNKSPCVMVTCILGARDAQRCKGQLPGLITVAGELSHVCGKPITLTAALGTYLMRGVHSECGSLLRWLEAVIRDGEEALKGQ